jgi:transposase
MLCPAGEPRRWVRSFARSLGQSAKTDRIDARVLALYAERVELKVRELPDQLSTPVEC